VQGYVPEEVGSVSDPDRAGSPMVGRVFVSAVIASLLGVAAWQQHAGLHTAPPAAAPLDGAPLLSAQPGAGPSGFTVLIGGEDPVLLDPATRAMSAIPELPRGVGALVSATRTAQGVVVVLSGRGASHDPGRLFRLDGHGTATPWGRGDVVQPGTDGDLLVLTQSPDGLASLASTVDGGHVRWERQLPRLTQMVRNTPLGLVIQVVPDVRSYQDGDLLLVAARTGQVRRRLGPVLRVLAASETTLAATRVGCAPDCPLLLVDLATGKQRAYALPGDPVPATAAFSPDGDKLAVSTFGLATTPRGPTPTAADPHTGRVTVLDASSGRVQQVPGLRTGRGQAADVAWAPDGVVLLIGVKWPTYERIALWNSASSQLLALPLQIPGNRPSGTLHIPPDGAAST